jgi:predicted AAA+ superfamily ATPase
MESLSRFYAPPPGHFFLFGPRGTGKTWWARQTFPDAVHVDLLDPEMVRRLGARPERLREIVAAAARTGTAGTGTVVIDEVQKLPTRLEVVHALIEEQRRAGGDGVRFVLTGSSARKLRRGGVNLLGGRAAESWLHPYMAAELGHRFRLDEALTTGLLPVIKSVADRERHLSAYNALYIKEEVQAEGLVRSTGDFARFLEAISFSHGSVLNLANVSRECGVHRKTAEGYLGILEDLLLGFRVPVFSRRAKRALAAHPKFYFFDVGVFRANRPTGPLDEPEAIAGAALEGLVAQHLRAWCDYVPGGNEPGGPRLFYWRTRSQVEVDFIVYGAGGMDAIEVTNSARIRPEDLRGLKAVAADYPAARLTLLSRTRERLVIDGITCLPVEEFLMGLKPGQPLRPESR